MWSIIKSNFRKRKLKIKKQLKKAKTLDNHTKYVCIP